MAPQGQTLETNPANHPLTPLVNGGGRGGRGRGEEEGGVPWMSWGTTQWYDSTESDTK